MKRNFLLRLIAKLDLFAVKGFNPLHEQIFEIGLITLSPGPYSLKFYPCVLLNQEFVKNLEWNFYMYIFYNPSCR